MLLLSTGEVGALEIKEPGFRLGSGAESRLEGVVTNSASRPRIGVTMQDSKDGVEVGMIIFLQRRKGTQMKQENDEFVFLTVFIS